MKKLIRKMSNAIQVVLAAPVQLPAKVLQVVRYVAIALGILESIVPDDAEQAAVDHEEEGDEIAK